MTEREHKSEVAQLMEQITLEYEAAHLGLHGLACGNMHHDCIIAGMEQSVPSMLQLFEKGKHQAAHTYGS
ncbi:MAG: hypothetical protein JO202_00195 [Ktedonobacteraceae bacterium]|nr:hypothetical protein [Ktedonobacteraceae bacterium]